jgi:hypothetical protein
MARRAYAKVRRNAAEEWDYEFSSVRYAAAIALKRLTPEVVAKVLYDINPALVELSAAWQERDVDVLIKTTEDTSDLGLQGVAALALGDLYGPLESLGRSGDAGRVVDRLSAMFTGAETSQSVRWAAADALSLLDSAHVTQSVVNPLLEEFRSPDPSARKRATKIRKTLAYLSGLIRLRDDRAHDFLVQACLGLEGKKGTRATRDWRTWATAITALGRVGAEQNTQLLAEIATGRARGKDLQAFFPAQDERNYVRRTALVALADRGNLELWSAEERSQLAQDPALARTYYQAVQDMYWRQEAAALAGLEKGA